VIAFSRRIDQASGVLMTVVRVIVVRVAVMVA
jgi:hypothetical protein